MLLVKKFCLLKNSSKEIDVEHLSKGYYSLEIIGEDFSPVVKKLIIK